MLNNKAQSLVVFVLFLPIIILFLAYVYDVVNINYQNIKLDSIVALVNEQRSLDEELDVCELIEKNDSDIECINSDEKIQLKKRVKSLFGKITENDYYEIKSIIKQ